jgi:hypothetical protein
VGCLPTVARECARRWVAPVAPKLLSSDGD